MSAGPSSPLLGSASSQHSASKRTRKSKSGKSDENTPLLTRDDNEVSDNELDGEPDSPSRLSQDTLSGQTKSKRTRRWPTIIAISLLVVIVIFAMVAGFVVPASVEEYAKQAGVFEPTQLSIDSFTADGVRARVRGDFHMDASRVAKKSVRDIGRFSTWIASKIETKATTVEVSLPEYGAVLLGTADIPSITVSIRNQHVTHIDFLTDVKPGDIEGIRKLANDWVEGRLGQLRIQAATDVDLSSGLIPLGTQSIKESLVFEGQDLPALPKYNISKLTVHDQNSSTIGGRNALLVETTVKVKNDYPIRLDIPSLVFDILLPNCMPDDPNIAVANATSYPISIHPKTDVVIDVEGIVSKLPKVITAACPGSQSSPLDLLIATYMKGEKATVFIRGSEHGATDTPEWVTKVLSSIAVPISVAGHDFGNMIKNFSLEDVHFSLPDPFAEPNSPDSRPQISATIQALIALPEEMNFSLNVSRVRAKASIFYHGKKLGNLDLHKWQRANSSNTKDEDGLPSLMVQSKVVNAPLEITDNDVFTDVVQAMLFGGNGVVLKTKADVDVNIRSALGEFVVRKIPAEGEIPVAPVSGGSADDLALGVRKLDIINTTKDSISFRALVNLTNPTKYAATVPFVNIHILCNDSLLADVTLRQAHIFPGPNNSISVESTWNPMYFSGPHGVAVGMELLSQYISGYNTTITVKTHKNTIPSQPALGEALSAYAFNISTPHLKTPRPPGDGDEDDPDNDNGGNGMRLIADATMHIFSSTATFTLLSPLIDTTLMITTINATAFYKHVQPVGVIYYDEPFPIPPGATTTPDLPVDWSIGGIGFDAIRSALGGTLKLDTYAHIGVKLGKWSNEIWYEGKGIGAKIRF